MPSQPEHDETLSVLLDLSLDRESRVAELLPLVYEQLRATAAKLLATERADHTLQPTALVHEAYMRLAVGREVPWANRAHYYAAAIEAMRRILLDHARAKGRVKRGGGRAKVELRDVLELVQADSETILAVDDAIRRLESEAPESAEVVRLRFFGGLNRDQAAEVLGISPRQVGRLWTHGRSWLYRTLSEES